MKLILAALLVQGWSDPPAEPLYRDAVACASSTAVESEGKDKSAYADALLTWGLVMVEFGRKAGRTKEQVDREDFDKAQPFYRLMKRHKPEAFAAHQAYCKALLP